MSFNKKIKELTIEEYREIVKHLDAAQAAMKAAAEILQQRTKWIKTQDIMASHTNKNLNKIRLALENEIHANQSLSSDHRNNAINIAWGREELDESKN